VRGCGPGYVQNLADLRLIRIDLHLHLVENGAEILVVLGVDDPADILEGETLIHGLPGDPYPGDITLADVHDPLRLIDEVMVLSLQDGFEVLLEVASRHLGDHGEVEP